MARFLGAILFGIGLSMSPGTADACMFHTDCGAGARCLKSAGSLYGACVGGVDRRDDYRDRRSTTGATCMFVTDCDPGQRCIKDGYSLYGACL